MSSFLPTYLRVVTTTRCNNRCSYCHGEGEDVSRVPRELSLPELESCLRVALRAGVAKLKLVGGEPFLRRDLPALIGACREERPELDISAITAGVIKVERLDAALGAGLTRVNVTIHGFGPDQLALRNPAATAHSSRTRFLEAVLERGRPLKLNYVYSGPEDRKDLWALLDWAAPRPVVVNVLDNLTLDMTWRDVEAVVRELCGEPARLEIDEDPHSLPARHLVWDDGLRVEIKHSELGERAPYPFCRSCPKKSSCREGTMALRLTSEGILAPCMHRPDLGVPLAKIVMEHGEDAALEAWQGLGEAA